MSDMKLNPANVKRLIKRVEPYKSLVSSHKVLLHKRSDMSHRQSRCEPVDQTLEMFKNNNKENEGDRNFKDNLHFSPPTSTVTSSSSDSSPGFQPAPFQSPTAMHHNSNQSEFEVSSVMTRSATRKYKTVGAIHNKVNFEQELKLRKKWPSNISYPLPQPSDSNQVLKDVVNRSFYEVLSFYKCAAISKNENYKTQEVPEDTWEIEGETASFIDLSPYLTQEPIIINGSDETQITLHLSENFLPEQYINIIPFSNEQDGALVIQEDDEEYKSITLQSGETYLFDNKYFSGANSIYFNPSDAVPVDILPYDPMMAVRNDHTYAQKYFERRKHQANQSKSVANDEKLVDINENEFKIEDAFKDLLLNTVILKCMICGETPHEVISTIDEAINKQ